jgi:hypothetical protein
MAGTWELICHHTYRGTPGVVADLSPLGASPGKVAAGLDASDFLVDGAAPGSGSVSFYKPKGRIEIPTADPVWQTLGAIRAEVTLRVEPAMIATLIDSNPIQLYIRSDMLNAAFRSHPTQYGHVNSKWESVGPTPYVIPYHQWVTFGCMHDGVGTMELYADGKLIARSFGPYNPIAPAGPAGVVAIGNTRAASLPANGQIDEVRIWRLNPHRFHDEFFGRPMDAAVTECWRRFLDELGAALRRHPDCARRLGEVAAETMTGMRRQVNAKGAESRDRLTAAADTATRLWLEGRVDSPELAKTLADLAAWLRLSGIDPAAQPSLEQFLASECMKTLQAEVRPPDCDPQVVALLRGLVESLGGGDRRPSRRG